MAKLQHHIVVTVPVYNEGPYILETLKSLADQTYSDFRVLVADNASTDDTQSICEAFCAQDSRFHYARHESNLGATANFKYCFENTESELFMWLGGHDVLHPEFLQEACARMAADPALSLVYSHTRWIDEHNRTLGQTNGGNYVFDEPLAPQVRFVKLLNALDRCEAINQVIRRKFVDLPFRPIVSADLVFLCHLAAHGPFARIERPLYIRREISKRTSTMMERITGKRVDPKYQELAAFFTESICSHRHIAPSEKPPLIAETLKWLNNRFSIFTPPALEPETIVEPGEPAPAPFFSVVMPVYNRERYLKEAIDSVLAQSDGDFELIVVDDGSTDRSLDIVGKITDPRLRLFRNQHGGGAAARNTGIEAARGDFIVWIDSDDRQAPGALAALRQAMQACPEADIYYGDLEIFDDAQPGKRWHTNYPDFHGEALLPRLIRGNCLPNPGTAVRRSLYQRYGGYDVSFTRCHDFQMWTRLADSARLKKVDATLCHWRQHGESLSSAKTRAFEAKVVQDMADRYPPSRLFPDLNDDASGQGAALWRVSQIHQELGESAQALRAAYRALALGVGDQARVKELASLCGAHYEPLFSVVLTTFNRPELLRDALTSLEKQQLRDFEVILINDNGEPVEHLLAAYEFPVTYIRQGCNQGLSAARNAGLKLARGRYVVYLDDDDIYLPNHFAVLADAFKQHPDSVVYTGVEYVSERLEDGQRIEVGRSQPFKHERFDRARLFVQNYIPVNTWAHPRAMLASVGEFDTSLAAFEDWDMLLRLATRYPFVHVPTVTSEVHTRVPGAGSDHMLGRERKNFPALYRELYSRYSDLDDVQVKRQRGAMLKRLGQAPNVNPGELVQAWLAARRPNPIQQRLIDQYLQRNQDGPRIGVLILDLQGDADAISQTLGSLQDDQQGYRNLQVRALTVGDFANNSSLLVKIERDNPAQMLNQAVAGLDSDWCVLVQAGERFTASGLLIAALELVAAPECRAIYADEIQVATNGEPQAVLRPDFNLDLLLSFPASMARHWLFRRDVFIEAGGFDGGYSQAMEFELVLRLIEQGGLGGLGHVSEPLLISAALQLEDSLDERRAIERHLHTRGYTDARVEVVEPGRYRLRYGHAGTPGVTIVVPALAPLAKLQRCVESILENTQNLPFELLLLARDDQAEELDAWLQGVRALGESNLRILDQRAGETLAAAQNFASAEARGEYLLFLSADTAVVQSDWLEGLLNHAQRPEVGPVGAKLLSPEGTIRHAGLILGLEGPAGSPFLGEPLDSVGYMHRLEVDQNYSAVSGDCLMISRATFEQLGGFEEAAEAARWTDVDLCLKARQAGYLTVWSPHVALMKEARREALSIAEQDALFARWLPALAHDPAYNPNLSLQKPGGFKLTDLQLSWRPLMAWRPLPVVLAHPADQFGCGHYRVMQPFKAQQDAGLIDGALSTGLMHVTDLERYDPDVIVLQRQIGDARLEAMRRMKAFSRAFKVYELDDYLPNLPMKSKHREHMPKDILKSLRRGLEFVDRFVVSTQPLAEAFAGLHPDIRVIENRLPVQWWANLPDGRGTQPRSKPRVGWAGGSSHTGDLEMIADVIRELANEVDWIFFGMCPEAIRPYVKEYHRGVSIDQYPASLARLDLDLALAPVEQHLFNECKSNLRLLEYGACGFPVVCSDVRCYQDSLPVTRVKNRFRDWVDAIRMHLAEPEATAAAGLALRNAVRRDWMLEGAHLERWLQTWSGQ